MKSSSHNIERVKIVQEKKCVLKDKKAENGVKENSAFAKQERVPLYTAAEYTELQVAYNKLEAKHNVLRSRYVNVECWINYFIKQYKNNEVIRKETELEVEFELEFFDYASIFCDEFYCGVRIR